jgi:hypothetical protein
MKLLIQTQIYENYGAHDWDGVGECPQYWKFKGGNDYVVKNFQGDETQAAMTLRNKIEQQNDFFRECMVAWNVVENDYLTEFEQSQLDYEGKIRFPAQELELV